MSRAVGAALLAVSVAGCRATEVERGAAARAASIEDLEAMSRSPRALPRPLLLISGWNDDPALWQEFRAWLNRCACNSRVLVFTVDTRGPGGARDAADRLCAEFARLGEVDVVAHSLGGLVAREAARECRGAERLRIVRLWTMATPHRGCGWSVFHAVSAGYRQQVKDCRPWSPFLKDLKEDPSSAAMELFTYRCRGDIIVSRRSAAAAGRGHCEYERAGGRYVHETCILDPRFARDVIAALLD
jgi:pimeloyl-ACP methyl ester carboxylesterase